MKTGTAGRTSSTFGALATLVHHVARHIDAHPIATTFTAALSLIGLCLIMLVVRWAIRYAGQHHWSAENLGTGLAAVIATGVSAQGMWMFMGDALHLPGCLRIAFFSFLEIMVLTSALRARAAQRAGAAGQTVDGIAMWVLTCLSATLSATDADNFGTVLFRLTAPLVAAWGWERSMALERRRRIGHRTKINWRFSPPQLLVRMRLATPDSECPPKDTTAHRNLLAVALAADDARTVRDSETSTARKIHRTQRRLHKAVRRATLHSSFVQFEHRDRYDVLRDHIAVLRSTTALVDLDPPSPWHTVERDCTDRPATSDALQATQSAPTKPTHEDVSNDDNVSTLPSPPAETTGSLRSNAHDPSAGDSRSVQCNSGFNQTGDVKRTFPAKQLRSAAHVTDHRPTSDPELPDAEDVWTGIAAKVCASDPAHRRDPRDVREILRLWHEEQQTNPQISQQVAGYSTHAVGRVVRQARQHLSHAASIQRHLISQAETSAL